MPGFPWGIGAGIGQGLGEVQAWNQGQTQNLIALMQLRQAMLQQQQQQYGQEAAQALYRTALGGGGLPTGEAPAPQPAPPSPTPTLGQPPQAMPQLTSGLPVAGSPTLPMGGGGRPYLDGLAQPWVSGLTALGVPPQAAQGAAEYMRRNESGLNPAAVNPTSGASYEPQWLGSRLNALRSEFGPNPSLPQRVSFMQQELLGPERRTLEAMRGAATPQQGYRVWGQDYERPGATALMKAQAAGKGPPPPMATEAAQAIDNAAPQIDPSRMGMMALHELAMEIERANPDAPEMVKAMALQMGMQYLAPEQRIAWEMLKQQNAQMFQIGQQNRREEAIDARQERGIMAAEDRQAERERAADERAGQKGWQIVTGPDGKPMRVNPNTGETAPLDLPAGTAKMGTQQQTPPASPSEIEYWARVLENGGSFPPGLSRTAQGSRIVQSVMAKIAEHGKDPTQLIVAGATTKANEASLRNMTKMSDAATSFERTANQNFDLALKLSKGAVPTDWGPWLNKFVETGETQAGNKDVPPYVAALLTAANEYAKIMSGSTGAQGSTVDSRREAAELFSPYLSAGQIDRVVAVAKADMANRKASLYGQVDDIRARLAAGGGAGQAGGAAQSQPPSGDLPRPGDAPASAAPNPSTGENPVIIDNQADYDALPPGAVYTGPDGKTYRKTQTKQTR